MPGKPRLYLPGVPCHIIQRVNNREVTFFSESCFYGCRWLAFPMTTSHGFLLLKCKNIDKYETGSRKIYKVDVSGDYSSRYQALKK